MHVNTNHANSRQHAPAGWPTDLPRIPRTFCAFFGPGWGLIAHKAEFENDRQKAQLPAQTKHMKMVLRITGFIPLLRIGMGLSV
jgi:hypothetical protein